MTYKLCNYVEENMNIVKSSLEQFDSNFDHIFGSVTNQYLKQKSQTENSDINYMLKFIV